MINTKNAIVTNDSITFTPGMQLLAEENGNRVGLMLYNDSNLPYYVYINWTEESDEDNYAFKIPAGSLYELPFEYTTLNFYGTWNSEPNEGTSIKVTEISDR